MSIQLEIPITTEQNLKKVYKKFDPTDERLELNEARDQLGLLWEAKKFSEGIQFGNLHWHVFSKDETFANLLGICYMNQPDLNQALACFISALENHPNSHSLLENTATTFAMKHEFKKAAEYFNKALKVQPKSITSIIGIGQVARRLNDFESAKKIFKLAIEIEPSNFAALAGLGTSHLDLEEYSEAIDVFNQCLLYRPNDTAIMNNLALTLQTLGKNEEASDIYKDLARDSNAPPEVFKNYCASTKISKDDPIVSLMTSRLQASKDKHQQYTLLFCLGKAHNDIQNFELAFNYFDQANTLLRELMPSDVNVILSDTDNIKLFAAKSKKLNTVNKLTINNKIKPIFIVGMPRSSSTLIEQIIASHPTAVATGENGLVYKLISPLTWSDENYEDNIKLLNNKYSELMDPKLGKKTTLVDKSLNNYLYLGFILEAFPNAKIIHSKRDARAVCWSIYKLHFARRSLKWAYNLDDITKVYKNHISMMDFWKKRFPGKIFDFDYDNLTNNSEDETRKVLNFCEMDWDPACLKFYENNQPVRTASVNQVRKKIYSGSQDEVKNYRPYLTEMFLSLEGY